MEYIFDLLFNIPKGVIILGLLTLVAIIFSIIKKLIKFFILLLSFLILVVILYKLVF